MAEEDRELERQKAERKAVKDKRRAEREERRRKMKKARTEEEEIADRIAAEERMLVVAQRKLESIRMLDELLERVKVIVQSAATPLPPRSRDSNPSAAAAG